MSLPHVVSAISFFPSFLPSLRGPNRINHCHRGIPSLLLLSSAPFASALQGTFAVSSVNVTVAAQTFDRPASAFWEGLSKVFQSISPLLPGEAALDRQQCIKQRMIANASCSLQHAIALLTGGILLDSSTCGSHGAQVTRRTDRRTQPRWILLRLKCSKKGGRKDDTKVDRPKSASWRPHHRQRGGAVGRRPSADE